jgi:transposase-like protein
MTRQRRSFDPSFKLEVVRMIKEQGLSISHVSQTMDIGVDPIEWAWCLCVSNRRAHDLAAHDARRPVLRIKRSTVQ